MLHKFYLIVISITLIGVAIGRFPKLKMNRATITLAGSTILLGFGAITTDIAFKLIDFNTIALLFSMMILNANLKISGFFSIVNKFILKYAKTPKKLLILIIISSGSLSAIFLNDTIVLILTPLILYSLKQLKINPIPFVLAIPLSSNIGSMATITGNPQNMIIGISSKIPYAKFLFYLFFPSFFGLILTYFLLLFIFKKDFEKERFEIIEIPEERIFKPLLVKTLISVLILLIGFFSGANVVMTALFSISILLITRRIKPNRVFSEIDWSLLVFFSGLFIITGTLNEIGFVEKVWGFSKDYFFKGIGFFSFSTLIISNLISNVPAVLLLKPFIPLMPEPFFKWLLLAMASTLAGNLTLIGSVANLIVAEEAKKEGCEITFWTYFKAGFPITIFTLIFGIVYFKIIGG